MAGIVASLTISAAALLVSLGAALYARRTAIANERMVEETRRARLEQNRPQIAIHLVDQLGDEDDRQGVPRWIKVEIENTGLGIATNVDSKLLWPDWRFVCSPSAVPTLEIQEKHLITFQREGPSYQERASQPEVQVAYYAAAGNSYWIDALELEVLDDTGQVREGRSLRKVTAESR